MNNIGDLHRLSQVCRGFRFAVWHVFEAGMDADGPNDVKRLVNGHCPFESMGLCAEKYDERTVAMWCTDHCYPALFQPPFDDSERENESCDEDDMKLAEINEDNNHWSCEELMALDHYYEPQYD